MAIVTVGLNPAVDRILECPNFELGGHQTVRSVGRLAAGKAANVARALAQLGQDCIATGFVGMEEVEFFHDDLMALGSGRILCHFIEVAGKTRENISILDPVRRVETHLRDEGFTVSPDECQLLQRKLGHLMRPGDTVIFAGSLCRGVGPDFLLQLITQATAGGALVALDTNGPVLVEAIKHPLWLLKPNLLELGQMLGRAVEDDTAAIIAAARPLTERIAHLLISRGERGAVLVTRDAAWEGRVAASGPVIRTVGCGDHLLAGFIVGSRESLETGLRTGLAVATARAQATDPAEFSPETMRSLLNAAEVRSAPLPRA